MSFQLIRSDEAHCQLNAESLQIKLLCKTSQLLFSKTSFLECVGYIKRLDFIWVVSLRIVCYKGHQYNTILDLNANCGIFHWRKLIRPIAFIQVNKKSWEEKKKKKFKLDILSMPLPDSPT